MHPIVVLDPDPFAAGRALATAARNGGLILGFASADRLVPELGLGIRLHAPEAPLRSVLVSGDGFLYATGAADFGVTALVLPPPFALATCPLADLDAGILRAKASLQAQLGAPPALALAFAPSGAIDGARIANALATHLPYPAVGGLAGDSGRLEGNASRLLVDGQPIPGEMVLIGLPASYAFSISTSHGGHPIGMPGIVEEVDGLILRRVSGMSAQDFIASRFAHPVGPQELGTLPLEITAPDGERQLRTLEAILPDGAIRFFGGFTRGERVQTIEVDRTILETHIAHIAEQLDVSYLQPSALIGISCAGRSWLLGAEGKRRELATVLAGLGLPNLPTIGLVSFGEIGPTRADRSHTTPTRFHNCTLVTLVLGHRP